jgi:hypothetical protein
MKKGKIILGSVALIAALGSVFALNANKRTLSDLYTYGNATSGFCVNKVLCHTGAPSTCSVTPIYTLVPASPLNPRTCTQYTGSAHNVPAL